MTLTKRLTIAAIAIGVLAIGIYANRLYILQYSLGWHTDYQYPRDANKPVPS